MKPPHLRQNKPRIYDTQKKPSCFYKQEGFFFIVILKPFYLLLSFLPVFYTAVILARLFYTAVILELLGSRIFERSSAVCTSSRANVNERGEFEQDNEWFYRTKVRRSSASLHSAKDDREKRMTMNE